MRLAAGLIMLTSWILTGCCGTCCKNCPLFSSSAKKTGSDASFVESHSAAPARLGDSAPSSPSVARIPATAPRSGMRTVDYSQPQAVPQPPPTDVNLPATPTGIPSAQMSVPPPPFGANESLPTPNQIAGATAPAPEEGWNSADVNLPPANDSAASPGTRQTIGVTDTLPRSAYSPKAD